jgi:hypothetical protein
LLLERSGRERGSCGCRSSSTRSFARRDSASASRRPDLPSSRPLACQRLSHPLCKRFLSSPVRREHAPPLSFSASGWQEAARLCLCGRALVGAREGGRGGGGGGGGSDGYDRLPPKHRSSSVQELLGERGRNQLGRCFPHSQSDSGRPRFDCRDFVVASPSTGASDLLRASRRRAEGGAAPGSTRPARGRDAPTMPRPPSASSPSSSTSVIATARQSTLLITCVAPLDCRRRCRSTPTCPTS